MRARLILAAGTAAFALAGSVIAATPALAAPCTNGSATGGHCDVTVTFAVTSGGLSLNTADTAATLSSVTSSTAGGAAAGALPVVTVTDARAGTSGWAVTLTSSAWTTAGDSITPDQGVSYVAVTGAPVLDSGIALPAVTAAAGPPPVPHVTAATGISLDPAAATALVSATSITGSNSAHFTPSVSVTVAAAKLSGTYTSTVTETVV